MLILVRKPKLLEELQLQCSRVISEIKCESYIWNGKVFKSKTIADMLYSLILLSIYECLKVDHWWLSHTLWHELFSNIHKDIYFKNYSGTQNNHLMFNIMKLWIVKSKLIHTTSLKFDYGMKHEYNWKWYMFCNFLK